MQKYLVLVPKTTQCNYSNLLYIPVILQEHTKFPETSQSRDYSFTFQTITSNTHQRKLKATMNDMMITQTLTTANTTRTRHYERERNKRGDNTGHGVVQESCSQGLYHTTSLSWLINSQGLPEPGALVLVQCYCMLFFVNFFCYFD